MNTSDNVVSFAERRARRERSNALLGEFLGELATFVAEDRARKRAEVDPYCPRFRAFCSLQDAVARMHDLEYAHYAEHVKEWATILAEGKADLELSRLRKVLGRE